MPIEAGTAIVEWARVRFADRPAFQRGARARVDAAQVCQRIVRPGPAVTFSRPPSGDAVEVAAGVMLEGAFTPVDAISVQSNPSRRHSHSIVLDAAKALM